MYALIIKPNAIDMAKEAYQWYEEQQSGLGDSFMIELDSCYDKLEISPISYTKIKKHFRHILLKKFPYVVIFEVINNDVIVYSVFHTSRNPRKKFRR